MRVRVDRRRRPFCARVHANGYTRIAWAATAEEAALHRARFVAYPMGAEAAEVRLEMGGRFNLELRRGAGEGPPKTRH